MKIDINPWDVKETLIKATITRKYHLRRARQAGLELARIARDKIHDTEWYRGSLQSIRRVSLTAAAWAKDDVSSLRRYA